MASNGFCQEVALYHDLTLVTVTDWPEITRFISRSVYKNETGFLWQIYFIIISAFNLNQFKWCPNFSQFEFFGFLGIRFETHIIMNQSSWLYDWLNIWFTVPASKFAFFRIKDTIWLSYFRIFKNLKCLILEFLKI